MDRYWLGQHENINMDKTIRVRQTLTTPVNLEIDFPFYAKHDLSDIGECTYYFKFTEDKVICLLHKSQYYSETYEIEIDLITDGNNFEGYSSSFLNSDRKSSKEEFDEAFEKFIKFIKEIE